LATAFAGAFADTWAAVVSGFAGVLLSVVIVCL
jgi:hypothetical protein